MDKKKDYRKLYEELNVLDRGFLIFGGTSEGRKLAEFLSEKGIPATLCVATEYGEEVLPEPLRWIRVRVGRLDEAGMEALIRELRPLAVVDATHLYAEEVTKNIRIACEKTELICYRMSRPSTVDILDDDLRLFEDCAGAADWLEEQDGKIFLTTGMKELPEFVERLSDKSRIYARVLLQEDVSAQVKQLGLTKGQIICMQGPFSKEMNVAMLHMTGAAFLVTKESGKEGGFDEKVAAAKEVGVPCVVIRRPTNRKINDGYDYDEIPYLLSRQWNEYAALHITNRRKAPGAPKTEEATKTITLVGIGMGDAGQLTLRASMACAGAKCIIGSQRALDSLKNFGKRSLASLSIACGLDSMGSDMVPLYKADEIVDFLCAHPEYENVVVAFSGDLGFYSGAKKLLEKICDTPELNEYAVNYQCGIPSIVYFAACLRMPWEDMVFVSMHGQDQNLAGAVMNHEKVFTLADNAESIGKIAEKLNYLGLGDVKMYVGTDLSYPDERIDVGIVRNFLNYGKTKGKLCVALFENRNASLEYCVHGLPDWKFMRGKKIPMTKEEVRSISISKLRLSRNSIVYDIGAGTGSVAVECARMASRGKVYAIECKDEACMLIAENRRKFSLANLEIVHGRAPEAFRKLPAPTHAFIGGSGGDIKRILKALFRKNQKMTVVVNCVTLKTLRETLDAAPKMGLQVSDIVSVNIAKPEGWLLNSDACMMIGQNPVYVVRLYKVLDWSDESWAGA